MLFVSNYDLRIFNFISVLPRLKVNIRIVSGGFPLTVPYWIGCKWWTSTPDWIGSAKLDPSMSNSRPVYTFRLLLAATRLPRERRLAMFTRQAVLLGFCHVRFALSQWQRFVVSATDTIRYRIKRRGSRVTWRDAGSHDNRLRPASRVGWSLSGALIRLTRVRLKPNSSTVVRRHDLFRRRRLLGLAWCLDVECFCDLMIFF